MKTKNYIYTPTNILDLAPQILKEKKFKIILEVTDFLIYKYIVRNIHFLKYYERIDTMKHDELDLFAEELDVDFYKYDLELEEKRKLCRTAFAIQMIKGTPEAIKRILNVFYKNTKILEFPEFNGEYGAFKIEIKGNSEIEKLKEIETKVNLVKKHSQHFTGITFKNSSNLNLNSFTSQRQGVKEQIHEAKTYIFLNNLEINVLSGRYTFVK
ncbi:MAG: phage tail protein [Fusobacteriales bacterium]|nr:MAG: phage tail protein [Fusobacteriales bacterium]